MSRKSEMRIDLERFLAMTAMMAAPLIGACAGEQGDTQDSGSQCAGGKCDEAGDPALFACQDVGDQVNGGTADLSDKNDPVAQLVLKAENGECPTTYQDLIKVLNEAEPDCVDESSFGQFASLIVSETAALLGLPENNDFSRGSYFYRAVTQRACGDREPFEVLFSTFGLSPGRGVPPNVEVIAMGTIKDDGGEERSIFNYYELADGKWEFHGNSIDFIEGDGGRCKNCHASGGLVMKELASPWVHWDSSVEFEMPGASVLIDENRDVLGDSAGAGATMEEVIVEPGNALWQDTRVRHLLGKNDLKRLLAPMFCSTEANLGTGSTNFVPPAALVDAQSTGFFMQASGPFSVSGVSVEDEAYARAIEGQVMTDAFGRELKGPDGSALSRNDTDFPLAFPQRAWTDLDMLDKLTQVGVIDAPLQMAIANVDFTRPVYSAERCQLLELVGDIGPILAEGGGEPEPAPEPDDGGTTGGSDTGLDTSVDVGNCCDGARGVSGCDVDELQACVCAEDDFCCTSEWDTACVGLVNSQACLDAVGAAGPLCEEPLDPSDEGGFVPPGFGGAPFGEDITVTPGLPDKIRDMLRAELEARSPAPDSAEGQLLANLDRPTTEMQGDADRFIAACEERPDDEFLADYMVALSVRRRAAMGQQQFEFDATFPQDGRDVSGDPRLDPETCELKR